MALYIGVMSGTSMDGVDAVLCDITPSACRSLAQVSKPYPTSLQTTLLHLARTPNASMTTLAGADRDVAAVFADAVLTLLTEQNLNADDIRAIGSHGQTVLHSPDSQPAFTLQIGDLATIAAKTGIDVVGDFRRKDIALGGQGAPLAPAFHAFQFASPKRNRILLNIGGIANISVLPAGKKPAVTGFDTGPGNTLMDAWCQRHQQQPFDMNGDWAATGRTNKALLNTLRSDDYFSRQAPKSTGPEHFNLTWLDARINALPNAATLLPHNVQATLLALTATTIGDAVRPLLSQLPIKQSELVICGGGAFNRRLVDVISDTLADTGITVTTSQQLGLHPQWVEGAAFAWLAWAYENNVPGNIPAVTGASRPAVLGVRCKAH